jgi:hypothetical protein
VAAFGETADVIHLPARQRGPWRAREHAFGLVAASFIIAVAALGFLRTTVDNPSLTRGQGVPSTSQPPPTTSGDEGENQEPQEPTNVDPQPELRPFGPVVLVSTALPAPKVNGDTNGPKPPDENDGNGNGNGNGDGGDGESPGDVHRKGYGGYDNPRVPMVGSHRLDKSTNSGHKPGDVPPPFAGDGHAVHGADGKRGK